MGFVVALPQRAVLLTDRSYDAVINAVWLTHYVALIPREGDTPKSQNRLSPGGRDGVIVLDR